MTPIILPIAELKPALTGLSKINDRSNKHPMLQHLIKIQRTEDGWITLTRTDLSSFITYRLEQPSQGPPFAFLASYEHLAGIVKTCSPKDTVTLSQTPDKSVSAAFTSHGEAMNVKIPSHPVEQFPAIPRIKGEPIPVPAGLRESIHQALECVSVDPMRAVLNGVYIDVSQANNHHITSTDGHHLFTANTFTLPLKHSFILPSNKFLGWREFNKDGEWQMKVSADCPDAKTKLLVQLSSRRWRLIMPAVEGIYPNWRAVMVEPGSIKSLISIDPQKVENLMGKIDFMPCHNAEHFPIGLELVNGKLSLLAKAAGAKAWERTPVDYVKASGPNVTIFLNRHLLIKALRFGLVDAGIVDSISPMRLSSDSREMVIMPCRSDLDDRSTPPRRPTNNRREASAPPPSPSPRRQPQLAQSSDVFTGIKVLRESFKAGLGILRSIASSLKEVRREQKNVGKTSTACT